MSGKMPIEITECGCCSHWHRTAYFGDCRNDAERFMDPDDALARLGGCVVISGEEDALIGPSTGCEDPCLDIEGPDGRTPREGGK